MKSSLSAFARSLVLLTGFAGITTVANSGAAAQTELSATLATDIDLFEREFLAKDRALTTAAAEMARKQLSELRAHDGRIKPEAARMRLSVLTALADNAGSLMLGDNTRPAGTRLPFRSAWFDDGLFILHAHSTHSDLVGAEILSVEGKSISRLTSILSRYRGGLTSRRKSAVPTLIESPALLQAIGQSRSAHQVTMRLRLMDGSIKTRTIDAVEALPISFWPDRPSPGGFPGDPALWAHAISPHNLPTYIQDFESPRRVVWFAERKTLYAQIKWTPSSRSDPLDPFKSAFESAVKYQPERLILDLRFDHGGSTPELVDYLKAQITDFAARGGRVAILIGPLTHESGIVMTAAAKIAGGSRSVLIGQPVGDRLQFWASGGRACLPYSGSCVVWANRRFDVKDGCTDPSCEKSYSGLRVDDLSPDLAVPSLWNDYLDGRDKALEAAFIS